MTTDRLRRYRDKRGPTTGEPPASTARTTTARTTSLGTATSGSGPIGEARFVVQRHRARRLHYDLRLEMAGVLASWAVPKGPTLDPASRRRAVHVEDHPIGYLDFEGVIPDGEYGAGDVIVWDRGIWSPAPDVDPVAAVDAGELHFDLAGTKLAGRFVLVRDADEPDQWLLLHKRDAFAVPGWDPEAHPRSVRTGRTNDEVAAGPPWPGPTETELASLDELDDEGTWNVGGRALRLTNLDKVLFPAAVDRPAITKRDLIRHMATSAPVMMPYLAGRPVNMHRYPHGAGTPGFWHKAVPSHAPDWLQRWHYDEAAKGDTEWYVVPDGAASLAWLANFGALELHPWTSTCAAPREPSWALIDIDPGDRTNFDEVVQLARLHRTALEHLGVDGRPKVTGRRGVQIWIPVARGLSFDDTRTWVEQLSRAVGRTVPELVSWSWRTDERNGLARLDYTQNARNKTLVAPFSPRAAAGAPVSVTLEWHELDDPALRPDRWCIPDIAARLAAVGDPLAPLVGMQQRLPAL